MTKAKLAAARLVDAQPVDAQVVDAHLVDEYAETQVLAHKPTKPPAFDDDSTAQSVYSEYVQDIERLLKADTAK